ncbi:MAG: DUF192 domain-containing protein [Candidatus Anstonellales archaeon]
MTQFRGEGTVRRSITFLIIFLSAIIALGCLKTESSASLGEIIITNSTGQKILLFVEIADTYEKRMRGLMYRESLPKGGGMLFVFEDSAPRIFWMKNTLIPLDIIFIDEEGAVVAIVENAQPCLVDPCKTYSSKENAKYVLEVEGGFARKNGVSVGSNIEIKLGS